MAPANMSLILDVPATREPSPRASTAGSDFGVTDLNCPATAPVYLGGAAIQDVRLGNSLDTAPFPVPVSAEAASTATPWPPLMLIPQPSSSLPKTEHLAPGKSPDKRGAFANDDGYSVKAVPERATRVRKPHKAGTVLLAILIVLLIAGAGAITWGSLHGFGETKTTVTPVSTAPLPDHEFTVPVSNIVGPDGNNPVELNNGGTMTSALMGPNTVFIPALGVYMSVESDGTFIPSHYSNFYTLRIPANPQVGVRYAKGGEMYGGTEGTTLIASHVANGTYGWGALRYLYRMVGGNIIFTKNTAGQLQAWQLTAVQVGLHQSFPQSYWDATGVRQLVLVTCGGQINRGHYPDNIFAIATPIAVPVSSTPVASAPAPTGAATTPGPKPSASNAPSNKSGNTTKKP